MSFLCVKYRKCLKYFICIVGDANVEDVAVSVENVKKNTDFSTHVEIALCFFVILEFCEIFKVKIRRNFF